MDNSVSGLFQKNAFFVIDRFHIAREIKNIFKGHKRYRFISKKLAQYDVDGFLLELNSAVGTLEDEILEDRLEEIIRQLSKYPEALGDYRKWLMEKGIDTSHYRPMGSAEGTMSVFAKRLKNGRSWSDRGIECFIDFMVALKDNLEIKTLLGRINTEDENEINQSQPKHYVEKLKSSVGEATRNNLKYLSHQKGKPVYKALQALQGF